jgi:predicted ATP-dependent protease
LLSSIATVIRAYTLNSKRILSATRQPIMENLRLEPQSLYTHCDVDALGIDTSNDLPDLDEVIGQNRALEAIRFGVGIRRKGFNLYVLGSASSGKHAVVQQLLQSQADTEPTPVDYCYVYQFADPYRPRAIALPAGKARQFSADMNQLVEELVSVIPEALESEEYQARREEFEEVFREQQGKAFDELQRQAEEQNIRLLRTPAGFAFGPMHNGEVIDPEEFQRLSSEERTQIEEHVEKLQERLDKLVREVPRWRREMLQQIKALNRDVVMSIVGQQMAELQRNYEGLPEVLTYLNAVQTDVVEHADEFGRREEHGGILAGLMMGEQEQSAPFLNRYQVNVLVDNSEGNGAPVVYLDNPTFANLVGRVEHQAQLGALVTDFTMIKPGALHEANGGYLILDARNLLMQPYAYEGLKRSLRSQEINIESLGQLFSMISTVSLEPENIPLNLKVVLVGERFIYYLLSERDAEFNELFKVAADFDEVMDRSAADVSNYAAYVATFMRRDELKPLDAGGVARVIEHASRMTADAAKLTTQFGKIADLLREADYRASAANCPAIGADHVQGAIDAREARHSRIRERLLETTLRGTLLIDTEGEAVGQVNGLSVMMLGEQAFGHPSRITARARLGRGEVVDIAREVELGGPLHSKGVLILQGFLAGRYCPERHLSLQASLVFEQTYGYVEGDSASAAELFALLSALANAPLRQSFAVTGSINQHGQIQPIGGVNEKIEGFFDLCKGRGLTGEQGVIIPQANVKHLMLRQDVVDAAARNEFHIYAITTADEGIALMSGVDAGERNAAGEYPDGSINQRVEARLLAMAEAAHRHERKHEEL